MKEKWQWLGESFDDYYQVFLKYKEEVDSQVPNEEHLVLVMIPVQQITKINPNRKNQKKKNRLKLLYQKITDLGEK
ncbi:MAG: hypothetical protein MRERV_3c053 [Mycoplasmataceae bacterium RV_VA103A]|nr:MAG: hypothetical protein MRERV_3c053 [Mycoplasmataceae bacterium RV_VA103A]